MSDLIERDTVLDLVQYYTSFNSDLYKETKELPCVQTESRWILCSERMPDTNQEVFVYLFGDSPYIAWYDGAWWTEEFRVDEDEEPIAWFPLPEPYTEGQG